MKLTVQMQFLLVIFLLITFTKTYSESGGPLSPEQAAYDVNFYDLELTIDPSEKTIGGSLLCRAKILIPIDTLVLDLDNPFTVDSILFKKGDEEYSSVAFTHFEGKLNISIPTLVIANDIITVRIYYSGAPRIALYPPWDDGFVWETTSSGKPWIGVACEGDGADVWWPCKDHPSDEPDSMSMSFTVPNPLTCVSNGRYLGSTDNGDNTTTFNWFISTPINNYNVTIYAAEYLLIEDTYLSVSGESIPFYFWVIPEDYNTAVNYMNVFLAEFNFIESICGPFPFGTDKHGWAHAPYWGMEHQTIIAYGHNFTVNDWGYDYIHYHELAHEWWGNLITAKDWSDIWIHEGLATYMEALYVEHLSGMDSYHQFMAYRRPEDNHTYPLAPHEALTASQAFHNLDSYYRGASVMHTLRYHLGDDIFFNLLKRWAYPNPTDFDNTNGRQCRILTTDDMKNQAEEITGRDLEPFFDVFFREITYPVLHISRGTFETSFSWETENNIPLDLNIPIQVNESEQIVEMTAGQGSANISLIKTLVIDPNQWILMAEPIITSIEDDVMQVTAYRLEQNYPNPFNPTTIINYELPITNDVKLSVYNTIGQKVRTLVNRRQETGKHSVIFNAAGLSNGLYYYKLETNTGYIQIRKFVLLK